MRAPTLSLAGPIGSHDDQAENAARVRWAGLGVCMGDGHLEALTCADHITGSFAEEGAAQAIERFVLKGGRSGVD